MKPIIKTLSVRVRDKHAKQLRQWAFEVNQVWNAANAESAEFSWVGIPEVGFINCQTSEFDLNKSLVGIRAERNMTIGAATVQSTIAQHAKSRKQFKKNKLNWRCSGGAKKALVIGAEANSRILDYTDRSTCVIFGDGAGAVVVEASEEQGILSTHMHSDGQYQDLLYINNPIKDQKKDGEQARMTMHGNDVYKVAVKTLSRIVDETLEANGLEKSDVDWLIPHQANIRIISSVAKKLGMPMEKVVLTIENQGNTSAASVPLALDLAVRDGRIKKGDTILMEAFGGGFVWGSALVRM